MFGLKIIIMQSLLEKLIDINPGCNDILDVWLFELDNEDMNNFVIQKEELNQTKWATIDEIKSIYENDKFLVNPYFEKIISQAVLSVK